VRQFSAPRQQVERQLVAIVAADIAGYSRLMGADEEGTVTQLKACRRELIDPSIARHRGRVVKTTGDGFLIEFSSPVEAVRCAVELQQGMIDRNADVPENRCIYFRIGINLGDVIVDDRDLYGDAVNIAARLENLADPGGICISGTLWEQIRDRLALPFKDRGEQSVKNIARSVRVYALPTEAVADLPASSMSPATLIVQPAGAPRLSIVVLPFANLSNDPEQQYFADGITEDLITDLSRIEGSLVISRNSAFTYRDKTVDTKQIGRELGVRYVLEGSVRRSGNRVRVNAQLIDAESDAHLWAERFDRDTSDLFALQDEITSRIAIALNLALVDAEAVRASEHPNALDYIFRGRAAAYRSVSRDNHTEAIGLYERALTLDPWSVEALSQLATYLAARAMNGMTDSAAADIARAEGLAGQAVAASPRSARAHYAKGQVLRAQAQVLGAQRRYEEAIAEYETALALNRNLVFAIAAVGRCKLMTGAIEEVIPLLEQAIRLSPRDPGIFNWYLWIGRVHLLQSRIDEAIIWLERGRNANPAHREPHAYLASAYALKGDTERAAAELAEARRLDAYDGRYSSIARLHAVGDWGVPKIRALYEATFLPGLRKAGMPEE
jgi:TolB-like protein/class 3 adenylate cyclase